MGSMRPSQVLFCFAPGRVRFFSQVDLFTPVFVFSAKAAICQTSGTICDNSVHSKPSGDSDAMDFDSY